MNGKKWFKSKTLWFNALSMVGGIFGSGGVLGHVLSPIEITTFLTVGNAILRLVTDKGLVK